MHDRSFIREWLLPPGVARALRRRVIRRRLRVPLTAKDAEILARNERFRGRYVGRRCFVIGNGPSLNRQDLSPLGQEITIVMNFFLHHPVLAQWKPTFHCRADPARLWCESPERFKRIARQTEGIDAQAYFSTIDTRRMIEQHALLPGDRACYFKPVVDLTEWPVDTHPLDMTRPMPHAGNTAHLAIMLALYLGCSPIYLLGLDHDWLADPSVIRHFYPPVPEAMGGTDYLGTYDYTSVMKDALREWRRYEVLRDMAARCGSEILNATDGSFLDVFPSVDFKQLLAAAVPENAVLVATQ